MKKLTLGGVKMTKQSILSFFLLCAVLFCSIPLFTEGADPESLTAYENEGKEVAVGMCDQSRSPLVRLAGKTYREMVIFVPVSNSSKRFYVVVKTDKVEDNEYFVKKTAENKTNTRKLSAMEWSAVLMPESMNFFRYIFFPEERSSDCSESKKQKP